MLVDDVHLSQKGYDDFADAVYAIIAPDVPPLTAPVSRLSALSVGTAAGEALRTGVATTGSRPAATAVPVGAQFYDSTLGVPIWSNGTVWKDAAGTTV